MTKVLRRNTTRFSRMTRVSTGAVVLLSLMAAAWAQSEDESLHQASSGPNANSALAVPPSPRDYLITPDDELEVYVVDVPEISRSYRVSPSGLIEMPLVPEPITAAGLTPEHLAKVIGEELGASGMVAHAHVTVQVKQSRVHSVAITGAVKKPQIYPLFGRTTLLDALSQAEGLADDAGNTAIVTRGDPPESGNLNLESSPKGSHPQAPIFAARTVKVDLKRLMEDGDPSLNLDLYPGDRVTVQRAGIVYVVGAVNRAGGFVLKNDREAMTVLKAIALAEDLKSTAVPKKAVIVRKNSQAPDGSEQLPVDLSQILSGHTADRPLAANDILFVPDSAGKKALHRAGEAVAQAAALFIYRVP